jgi:plastocyanin
VVVSGGSWATAPISISGNTRFLVVANDPISGLPSSLVVHDVSYNPTPTNTAPTITGSPAITVNEDSPYSFTPTASDVDAGDTLTFSITNKPTWASFNTATGALTGTPANADVGSKTGILISVTDGTDTTSLAAFNLTVVNVNDSPVINGTPATSVNEDSLYSFTPTASDVDASTTLAFSIANKPAWASFSTATGALTGTPTNGDVGSTNGIVISVSDGTTSAALSAFNLSVVNVNDAPTITGSPAITVNEDSAYSYTPTANDVDVGDTLTFSITNKPDWASFNSATGALTGTPANADVGSKTGIVISVSDGTASSALSAFNLTVVNVNDVPIISGTPATSVDEDIYYSFIPTVSDVDVDDTLTFSIINQPSWASFNTTTGALTGTPSGQSIGKTTGIVISVTDGLLTASLPAFDIEVISTIDPLQPIVTAPDDVVLNSTGIFTPVTLQKLLGLADDATQSAIEEALKALAYDGVSGFDCCIAAISAVNGAEPQSPLLLKPGRYEITWKTTNAVGVSGEATQILSINPLVSFSNSQVAVRGSSIEFSVELNGPAPEYPLSIPYVIDVDTTATSAEHNLVSGTATFTNNSRKVVIPVDISALTNVSDSKLVVAFGPDVNEGHLNRHVIELVSSNVPPQVSMAITQGGSTTSLITPGGGPVTATVTVTDQNQGDTHSFDWSATSGLADTDGNVADSTRVFEPAGLNGSHSVRVTVTDSAGASVQTNIYFRVVSSLPVLDADTDTDQDGISDQLEGTGDYDDNGIPNYQDNMPSPSILPQQGNITNAYLIECDPDVRCGLGLFARGSTSGGVQILDEEIGSTDELIIDPVFEPVGGIFDFEIRDLPIPGQSTRVVIPQLSAISANAVYRKYQGGRWLTFIQDANNALHSAPGNSGYCPPPGSSEWSQGLTAGHLCVRLTIEDGGANDADGEVNSTVVDPGAVSVRLPNAVPVAVTDQASTNNKVAITVDVLANDTDADGNPLTLLGGSAEYGQVLVVDNKLRYVPKVGFVGLDTVTYRMADLREDEAQGILTVTVEAYPEMQAASGRSSGAGLGVLMMCLLATAVACRRNKFFHKARL